MRPGVIDRLPGEVRDRISQLRAEGHTIDQVLASLRADGIIVSRSALARHTKKLDTLHGDLLRTRRVAEAALARAQDDDGPRQLIERLHSRVARLLDELEGQAKTCEPEHVKELASAVAAVARVQKLYVDCECRLRRKIARECARRVAKACPKERLPADTATRLRDAVLEVRG